MSIEAYKNVWQYGLKGAQLNVALCLAEYHNAKTGQCNPSIATIAEATGLSDRHVQRIARQLQNGGYIEIDESRGRNSHQYTLNPPPQIIPTVTFQATNPDTTMSPLTTAPTVTSDAPTVTSDAPTVTFEALNPDIAMSPEPENRRTGIEPGGKKTTLPKNQPEILQFPQPPSPNKPAPVLAYCRITGFWPPKTTYKILAAAVPDTPTEISRFEQVIRAWITCGWNPKNLNGILDYFNRHQIPGEDYVKHNKHQQRTECRPVSPATPPGGVTYKPAFHNDQPSGLSFGQKRGTDPG